MTLEAARARRNLPLVVDNPRFLILPGIGTGRSVVKLQEPMKRSRKASNGPEFEFNRLRHDDGRRRPFLLLEQRTKEFRKFEWAPTARNLDRHVNPAKRENRRVRGNGGETMYRRNWSGPGPCYRRLLCPRSARRLAAWTSALASSSSRAANSQSMNTLAIGAAFTSLRQTT